MIGVEPSIDMFANRWAFYPAEIVKQLADLFSTEFRRQAGRAEAGYGVNRGRGWLMAPVKSWRSHG